MSKVKLNELPDPNPNETPLEYSVRLSDWYYQLNPKRIKGQIFTPAKLAKYMTKSLPSNLTIKHVLDPGVGTGSLSCALLERITSFRKKSSLILHAVENDSAVAEVANQVLSYAKIWAKERNTELNFEIFTTDFIDFGLSKIGLEANEKEKEIFYDLVIMNPPYYKLNLEDPISKKTRKALGKNTNMYTLFISLATQLIRKGGYIVSVNPRSFLSGKSFEDFRNFFFNLISPYRIHRFISREEVFSKAEVLQEIVILTGVRNNKLPDQVSILSSNGTTDISARTSIYAKIGTILSKEEDSRLALPITESDIHFLDDIRNWKYNLGSYEIDVSTGPVVPFRSKNLVKAESDEDSVPLLWMQNVQQYSIKWPLESVKPQYIKKNNGDRPIITNGSFILLRRFISKDTKSRLISSIIPDGLLKYQYIGIENHLNILHKNWHSIDSLFAAGLCGILNSKVVSRIFHLINGTTQVNAYDLRLLPLPDKETILQVGKVIESDKEAVDLLKSIDSILNSSFSI